MSTIGPYPQRLSDPHHSIGVDGIPQYSSGPSEGGPVQGRGVYQSTRSTYQQGNTEYAYHNQAAARVAPGVEGSFPAPQAYTTARGEYAAYSPSDGRQISGSHTRNSQVQTSNSHYTIAGGQSQPLSPAYADPQWANYSRSPQQQQAQTSSASANQAFGGQAAMYPGAAMQPHITRQPSSSSVQHQQHVRYVPCLITVDSVIAVSRS